VLNLYRTMSERHIPAASPEERFSELFRQNYGLLLAFARRRVDPILAQDIIAETFLKAWRHFDVLPAEPLLWLYSVARGEIANRRRGLIRRQHLLARLRLLSGTAVAPDHAEAVVDTDRFALAFRSLREADREILRLVAWEGLTAAEAAYVLGCSPATFNVRLHRARQRLSALVEDEVLADGSSKRAPNGATCYEGRSWDE
jgi:RNA polymerase sigma-70 factor (ECF subfamily)